MSESQSAWKLWTSNPCYAHFLEIIKDIKVESIADEDRVPTAEISVAIISECRGVRKGLNTLLRRIEDILPSQGGKS